ncbi:hypothetical protein [Halonotius pteroides]|jgi:hypothetical protein|uniref:VRR-NUC domain-containing protein n=1 Tax=Halonotius pteroides TaxID=268735 RepID=A0A3A6QQW0_9EURY|nr:hypothetical protein [Halonotius pteroides]RJX50586.1 hypothetical protein DP106_04790 [Halonotius pteroides]
MAEYDSGTYEIHLRDENRNDLEVFLYDYSGKKLTGRGASEKFVEHWFDDDNHDGRWGDAVYDHFNTPDNKADDASFVYPQQNNSSQPDPPPGHEDFEFLDNNDYVSKPPNPVAERIAKRVERNLSPWYKRGLVSKMNEDSTTDIHWTDYAKVPYMTGVPDLLVWNEECPRAETEKFVEVKSADEGILRSQAQWFAEYDYFDNYTVWIVDP